MNNNYDSRKTKRNINENKDMSLELTNQVQNNLNNVIKKFTTRNINKKAVFSAETVDYKVPTKVV